MIVRLKFRVITDPDGMNNINLFETIKFSGKSRKKIIDNLMSGLTGGLFFWPIYVINEGVTGGLINRIIVGLIFGLVTGLSLFLTGVLTYGLIGSLTPEELKTRNKPNQGIKESAKNTVILSLIIFAGTFLLSVSLNLVPAENVEPIRPLIVASGMAMFFGFLVPGKPVIQHFVLRLILWGSGSIPWDYADFLSYATERRLIKQVGGRYRFIHDLLREHFAST
ncbi:MAG: hypothetical protein F6K44_20230 [Moorea sp. SIO3E2]|nr:hypothetical protein [Moorena sp. SIO3E2]